MDKTIIISDLHLGSFNCQSDNLLRFLSDIDCQRLILNGDTFESLDFRNLKRHNHYQIFSRIRELSDKMEVVWVCGNHEGDREFISHLIGTKVVDEYEFLSGINKVLVLHGHIFDDFLDKHPILTTISDIIYNFLQRIDKSHRLARFAKHSSKSYLKCQVKLMEGAINMAKEKNCQIVACGHSHSAMESFSEGIHYYNSGCWTELPCTYLEVYNGLVKLKNYG